MILHCKAPSILLGISEAVHSRLPWEITQPSMTGCCCTQGQRQAHDSCQATVNSLKSKEIIQLKREQLTRHSLQLCSGRQQPTLHYALLKKGNVIPLHTTAGVCTSASPLPTDISCLIPVQLHSALGLTPQSSHGSPLPQLASRGRPEIPVALGQSEFPQEESL